MEDTYKYKGMRKNLVNELIQKGIKDRQILRAICKIPRHYFFEKAFFEHAYEDKAFPIGYGQTISQPYTVAYQTELLNVKKGHNILEIGTGSGYQVCVLLELGVTVHSIEYRKELFKKTSTLLPLMGYQPSLYWGDGSKGLPSAAPFDGIIVTAGAPGIPKILINQLKIGGRLIIPVGDSKNQSMVSIEKISDNKIKKKESKKFAFVPLVGEFGWNEKKM